MPSRPKRPCYAVGCHKLTDRTYCEDHKPDSQYEKNRESSAKRGYDRRWRAYRTSYLRRHPLCVRCHEGGRPVPATEVDHIRPHRGDMELFWDPNNHQGLCKSCHSKKTRKGL